MREAFSRVIMLLDFKAAADLVWELLSTYKGIIKRAELHYMQGLEVC